MGEHRSVQTCKVSHPEGFRFSPGESKPELGCPKGAREKGAGSLSAHHGLGAAALSCEVALTPHVALQGRDH